MNGAVCPLSPSRLHRVYYSARHAKPVGVMYECRDCSQTIAFINGAWQVPPPGEIIVGLMAEFQSRMIEGDPDGIRNPLGIFGAAPATMVAVDILSPAELIEAGAMYHKGKVSILPGMPRIPS